MHEDHVSVFERRVRDDLHISVVGELDSRSVPTLRARFEKLPLDRDLAMVTLDLLSLTFMDSAGLSALIELHRRTDALGIGLRVVNVHETQRQVLDICGLVDLLSVEHPSGAE